jgi:putative aminopeptidase FrvX
MHSVVEMADLADVEKVIALLAAFVLSLGEDDDFGVNL